MKNKLYNFLRNYTDIEYDIFSYGLNILCSYSIVCLIILFFSIVLNIVKGELLFWILFIPLKKNTGGFHFNSKSKCIVSSIISSIIISYTFYLPVCPLFFRIMISLVTIIATYKIKTLNHPNKKLNDNEIYIYTKRAIIIEFFYSILIFFPFSNFYINIITTILFYTLFNLLIAKMLKQG